MLSSSQHCNNYHILKTNLVFQGKEPKHLPQNEMLFSLKSDQKLVNRKANLSISSECRGKPWPGLSQGRIELSPALDPILGAVRWHCQVFLLGDSHDPASHFLEAPGAVRAGIAALSGRSWAVLQFWGFLGLLALLCKS